VIIRSDLIVTVANAREGTRIYRARAEIEIRQWGRHVRPPVPRDKTDSAAISPSDRSQQF